MDAFLCGAFRRVDGWDDPRLSTLAGVRRRGYTPRAIRLFAERIGVSKADSWIDMTVLEDCLREDLNESASRRIAILKPLKLIIDNYPEHQEEDCFAPNHPQQLEWGKRTVPFSKILYIEQDASSLEQALRYLSWRVVPQSNASQANHR